jgi:hypothetical protein
VQSLKGGFEASRVAAAERSRLRFGSMEKLLQGLKKGRQLSGSASPAAPISTMEAAVGPNRS